MSLPATAAAARDLSGTWLAHLRRDPRGLPIPWINRWGGESAAATRIACDPTVGRLAVFHDDHGDEPDFTRQNMGRQRQAMLAGLCQVCGRPCPWARRNLVISSVSCETVTVEGGEAVAINEPWLDDRCAAIATLLCPALIRRRHGEDLHVVPVHHRREAVPILSVGQLDDGMATAAHLAPYAGVTVAMWVKILLPGQPIAQRDKTAPAR